MSPPPRNSTSSPPRAAAAAAVNGTARNQKPATTSDFQLIDTTNMNSTPSRPILKGDVWESISSLDIPATRSTEHAVLVPQGATATTTTKQSSTPLPTEIGDWSPLGSDSSKEQENTPTFRFQETISGTVTEEELLQGAEARKNDNLVDFEDLISSSAPVMSPNFTSSSVVASPLPSNRTIASDLLNMDQMETIASNVAATTANTTTTTTTTTATTTTTNGGSEATTNINVNKNDTLDESANNTAESPSVVTSAATAAIHDFASLMNGYKSAAAAAAAESASSPEPATTDLDTLNYTNASPSTTTNSTPPPLPPTTTTTTTTTTTLKEEAAYTLDTSSRSTPETKEKKSNLIKLRVQLEKGSIQLALDGVSYFI